MLRLSHFFLVLGLVVLTACSSAAQKKKEKQAHLYFGAGTESLINGDYTDALTNLLKANELSPNNSEIINNLGMAYYFKGSRDLAVKSILRAIELNDKNSDAKVNLASIYYRDGDIVNAEKLYKKVLTDLTYDKQARTLYNLGVLELEKKRNVVAAENYFKKSINEDDNYCPSYFQLGLLQFNRKQFNSAMKNFKESTMGTCAENAAGHYYMALTLTELRRFTDARLKLDEVETRFKRSPFAAKARSKASEINELENLYKSEESHASRKVLESPEF